MTDSFNAAIYTTPFLNRSTNMPSMRRVKIFGLFVVLFVVTVLFYTASLRQSQSQDSRTASDFYDKTVNALNNKKPGGGTSGDEEVAAAMAKSLKEAAQVAKDNANAKAPKPDPPSSILGVGSAAEGAREEKSVAGRKKFTTGEAQEPIKNKVETQEDHDIEVELNSILKKSPIIIFSKSYCPHSKRAKDILLEKYIINPAPFVVELDKHELGPRLQAKLAELTGRSTVPNVLINAVSIGGGDDVADLDAKHTLISKVKSLGLGKIVEVRERPVAEEADKPEPKSEIKPKPQAHGLR
ncbi:Monothiol glutaredoxin-7 [Lachnellula hyalina]|uniref:Monothiol glutaredoxin-7 n=1 Tax=Lachnellula hyalina TaxID=1316788 RepID=A0A8H8U0F2_9HELO|nr:Monothiol glutaredoxin-7 [Lachnellula hyalina]TVY26872.1 Monothiol glutaredoxin-7 [Lachnellula hyalina]